MSKAEKTQYASLLASNAADIMNRAGVTIACQGIEEEHVLRMVTAQASMQAGERDQIVKPLAAILAETKLIVETGPYANHLALVMGVGMYSYHVWLVYKMSHPEPAIAKARRGMFASWGRRKATAQPQQAPYKAEPMESYPGPYANGVEAETYSATDPNLSAALDQMAR